MTGPAVQRFGSGGIPLGSEVIVSSTAAFNAQVVAMDDDGEFTVLWADEGRILGRTFDAAGNGGAEFVEVGHSSLPYLASQPAAARRWPRRSA